ncbi:MAG TPA: rhomboid family intramembrane serine protease [Terracidiphilus sp.]|nr:rhomboid family intramembrane serine protease [Terracidiphilus sp.]
MGSVPPNYERGPITGEPEILPPSDSIPPLAEYGDAPPPQPPRRKSRWAMAPGTYTLVGMNCAVYLLMVLTGVNPITPNTENLYVWGANNAGAVLLNGDWWRIVTAMFVHGGILHLALNMWCLWNLGLLAEPLMGTFGVFAVYILTGAAGNLLSTFWNFLRPIHEGANLVYPVGVGASGAVFGIAGALIVLLKTTRLPVPPEELKKLRRSVIYFAVINLVIGLSINVGTSAFGSGIEIDNFAHLGGCASGLLFAVPMVPRIGSPRASFLLRRRVAVGMLTGILVLFGFYLSNLPPR